MRKSKTGRAPPDGGLPEVAGRMPHSGKGERRLPQGMSVLSEDATPESGKAAPDWTRLTNRM